MTASNLVSRAGFFAWTTNERPDVKQNHVGLGNSQINAHSAVVGEHPRLSSRNIQSDVLCLSWNGDVMVWHKILQQIFSETSTSAKKYQYWSNNLLFIASYSVGRLLVSFSISSLLWIGREDKLWCFCWRHEQNNRFRQTYLPLAANLKLTNTCKLLFSNSTTSLNQWWRGAIQLSMEFSSVSQHILNWELVNRLQLDSCNLQMICISWLGQHP